MASQPNRIPFFLLNPTLSGPGISEGQVDLALMFAQCADRARGFEDLSHDCPFCREDLNLLARYGRATMHVYGCYFDDAQRQYNEEKAARTVQESATTYSCRRPAVHVRRATIAGQRFCVGDLVVVMTRETMTDEGTRRLPVATGRVALITRRGAGAQREYSLHLAGLARWDGRPDPNLDSADVAAELCMPVTARGAR